MAPTITVTPAIAPPGDEVSVDGTGWDKNFKFALTTQDSAGVEVGQATNQNRPRKDGTFHVAIRVPPRLGPAKVKAYKVIPPASNPTLELQTEAAVEVKAVVEPPPSDGPTITNGPVADNLTSASAAILWTCSKPVTGQVEYGLTDAYGQRTNPELSFTYSAHVQSLTGLSPDTVYHFRVVGEDEAGNPYASPDKVLRTLAVADPPPPPPPPPPPSGSLPPESTLKAIPVNNDPKPAYLASIIDSTFGAKITCVGNENGKRNSYPTLQPWNADKSLAFLSWNTPGFDIIDGGSGANGPTGKPYEYIREAPHGLNYPFWSAVDPDLMLGNTNPSNGVALIRKWRPSTGVFETLGSISGLAMLSRGKGEGGQSRNDRRAAFNYRTTTGEIGVLVWDFQLNREISRRAFTTGEPDNCSISVSGEFVIVAHNNQSGSGPGYGTWLYRAADMAPRYQISPVMSHRDVAVAADGGDLLAYVQAGGAGAAARRLLDQTTAPPETFVIAGSAGIAHISGGCWDLPGYVLISCNTDNPTVAGNDQLYLVKTDGSKVVRVFCFAHTAQPRSTYKYELSTHGSVSRDGTKVMWGGGWSDPTENVGYVAEMP